MERKLTLGMLSALLPQNEKENESDLDRAWKSCVPSLEEHTFVRVHPRAF